MAKPIFIIENLEPKIWKWLLIEYKHISKIVGKNNLWFTNIKGNKLNKLGKTIKDSVKNMNLKNACILDPEAKKTITPQEAKSFNFFILGGILGNYPPEKRTKKELTRFIKNAKARNIGKAQLPTDNAVLVVKQILKGKPLNKMQFTSNLTIKINDIESITLPFRYLLINNKPVISKDIIHYLKNKKSF